MLGGIVWVRLGWVRLELLNEFVVSKLAWLANLIRQTCIRRSGIGELELGERS